MCLGAPGPSRRGPLAKRQRMQPAQYGCGGKIIADLRTFAIHTCRGSGRRAWMRASNARVVPCSASRERHPVRSADTHTRSARIVASTPIAHIAAVPFVRDKPSLAARKGSGASPAAARASPPGMTTPRNSASPRPRMGSDMCASCAKSPLAPSEPFSGMTGCTPALSMSARS